jgi:argininosuccinate lyase
LIWFTRPFNNRFEHHATQENPDVFELIRGKCNKIQALPYEITLITNNLPSGYHRDLQLLKEGLFPAIQTYKLVLILLFSPSKT